MALDQRAPQTRRRVLLAAAGGAAALAASHLAKPEAAAASVSPMNLNLDNPSTALTSITQGTADTDAFGATANGAGTGVAGVSTTGVGVKAVNGATNRPAMAALQGDTTGSEWDGGADMLFGAYGFSNQSGDGVGTVGESGAGIGLLGFAFDAGGLGLMSIGSLGAWIEGPDGAFVISDSNGTGLHAHTGVGSSVPNPPANTALYASVDANTQVGLEAHGRIRFPNRSGRSTIAAGKSSVTVLVPSMTKYNFAIATLNSSRPGIWVRAVACDTGKITIYLNAAVSSTTILGWLVLG
jgi:hypothetical protein